MAKEHSDTGSFEKDEEEHQGVSANGLEIPRETSDRTGTLRVSKLIDN